MARVCNRGDRNTPSQKKSDPAPDPVRAETHLGSLDSLLDGRRDRQPLELSFHLVSIGALLRLGSRTAAGKSGRRARARTVLELSARIPGSQHGRESVESTVLTFSNNSG